METQHSTAPDAAAKSSDRQSEHIQAELIHVTYKQSPIGIVITAISAVALTYLLWGYVPHGPLVFWLISLLSVALLRTVLVHLYHHYKVPAHRAKLWGHLNNIGLAVTGVIWGATMVLTFPVDSLPLQLCIALILCGIIATGIGLYGVMPSAVIVFSLPISLAWIIRFLTYDDAIHIVIAGMAVLYMCITVFTSRHIARVRRQLLITRFTLANRVTERSRELKETNAYLQTEIKERKNIEERLRQERDRLEIITTTIGAGLAVISTKYRILWSNQIFQDIFGGTAGKPCYQTKYQNDSYCAECGARKVFEQGYEKTVHEKQYADDSGNVVWFQIITTPIRNEQGRIRAALELVLPITERKQAETAKRSMVEKLQEARKTEAIATLAGGIAHQFNNALAVIAGNVELLEHDYKMEPQVINFSKPILKASKKMTQLTSQLLAYAEGGKYKENPCDLGEVVSATLSFIDHTIPKTIPIEMVLDADLPRVKIDTTQIQMVVSSIVSNAVEATEDGDNIRITCQEIEVSEQNRTANDNVAPGRYVMLTTTDNGQGMEAETRERIFEPFFTTKFEGRGLGMAAVYGIIKNHNGYIHITSQPEEGTQVRIYLPALEEVAPLLNDLNAQPVRGSGTILMVEDDIAIVEVNQAWLKRIGYKVIIATTAHEAIEIISHTNLEFDLVMLDLVLPDMEGAAIYPHIRKNRPLAKVIICTGYGQNGTTQELLDAGADGFIQKPFTLNQLSAKLSQILS